MSDWNDTQGTRQAFGSVPRAGGDVRANYDEGLRSYMLSIYNYMASAVLLTGIVAVVAAFSGFTATIMSSGLGHRDGIRAARLHPCDELWPQQNELRHIANGLLGVCDSHGPFDLVDIPRLHGESIAVTFFATAGAFAGLSLWGYTTKKTFRAGAAS